MARDMLARRAGEWALVALLAFVSAGLVTGITLDAEDLIYKLVAVQSWAAGEQPDFNANHHILRWGVNLPAIAWTWVFGEGASAYLALNYAAFACATAWIFATARAITNATGALIALAIWFLNPMQYWLPGNNLSTELYSVFYLTLSLALLHWAYARNTLGAYAIAMAALFALYGAKESNLFFMPGLVLYEIWRRRYDRIVIMAAVFGGGWAVETLIVNGVFASEHLRFGRFEVLAQGDHAREMETIFIDYQPIDIIRRWGFLAETNLDRLEFFNKAAHLLFFAAAGWFAWRAAKRKQPIAPRIGSDDFVAVVCALGLSYAFCNAFFITSLNPFRLGQPLNDRYLWAMAVPEALVFGAIAGHALKRRAHSAIARPFALLTALALVSITALGTLSRYAIDWAWVNIRRDGQARPYAFLDVDEYLRQSVRAPLERGCTLVFGSPISGWGALVKAFPHDYFERPEQLFVRGVEGLPIADGGVVRRWRIEAADWPGLPGKLHADHAASFRPVAIRFELPARATCSEYFYLGYTDIARADQPLPAPSGETGAPPPLTR